MAAEYRQISERPEEYTTIQEEIRIGAGKGRQVSGVGNFEFDCSDAADVADIRYAGCVANSGRRVE